MSKKWTLFVLIALLALGCNQEKKSADQINSQGTSASQDSVLFQIDKSSFEASFQKVNDSGHGSASGPLLFQRLGSLSYIFDELYADQPVKVLSNPYLRQNFKIGIRWKKGTDFRTARDSVLSQLQSHFNFDISRDSIMQEQFVLSVIDVQALNQAIPGKSLKESAKFKSELRNGQWSVLATLPRFAEALGSQLERQVRLESNQTDDLYRFELNLQKDIDGLRVQLENRYGLTLQKTNIMVEQISIAFNDS